MHVTAQSKNIARAIDVIEFFCRGKTMAIDHKTPGMDQTPSEPETNFSYGVREMRQAKAAKELSVDVAPRKAANENRGFDPYNTSGSFDRTKNWMRIGKR
jgi:hypothetical protein